MANKLKTLSLSIVFAALLGGTAACGHIPEVHVPDVHVPDVHVPDVHVPDVHVPDVRAPEVQVPDVQVPDGATNPGAVGKVNAIVLVSPYTRDLDDADATQVVKAACTINDAVSVMNSDDATEAAGRALASVGGERTFALRVVYLAKDMASANSSGDAAQEAAVAAACEAAG